MVQIRRPTSKNSKQHLQRVTMRNKEDLYLRNLLMEEMVEELQEQRNQLRQDAKRNIQKIQAENKRTYDRKRKKAPRYRKGDLVAIQRTQFGSGLKLGPKFLGPYKIIEVKPRDRERDVRDGGPKQTEVNREAFQCPMKEFGAKTSERTDGNTLASRSILNFHERHVTAPPLHECNLERQQNKEKTIAHNSSDIHRFSP
ncbi:uncharacterized protein TNIN_171191 [Trichonephila inaurata madagascariensis]|uniref:Uncharacterized protein n=1 Tax=Trichonephila inaurata madagascariensis TaxID=2747483 RepID=A0A8X7CRZ9_9ARAC|nr:uncharacterized protein TNIN_171191 [Trichonephila inaurata madagascariensis]